jgi:hypothetical protein
MGGRTRHTQGGEIDDEPSEFGGDSDLISSQATNNRMEEVDKAHHLDPFHIGQHLCDVADALLNRSVPVHGGRLHQWRDDAADDCCR